MTASDNSDQKLLVDAHLILDEIGHANGPPTYQVTGDTHPYRHLLREAGGKWDAMDRAWRFSDSDPTAALAEHLRANPALISDAKSGANSKPHYHGHRERLRNRFTDAGADSLPDYELLELLLFQCISRIDVKPLAKQLIEHFGSLGGVFAASPRRLSKFEKMSYATVTHLKALHEASKRLAHEEIANQPVLGSWDKLMAYLKTAMAHESTERFHILFLNAKNILITDEIQKTGTVNHTPVYPRYMV